MSMVSGNLFQGEKKGGALARTTLGPYPATMALDDPLHRGQAYAVPLCGHAGNPLEGIKQLSRLR